MTEYRMSKYGTYLLKNDKKLYNLINECDEIADLLNKLALENKKLKKRIKKLNEQTLSRSVEYKSLHNNYRDLKLQNEQLKKQIEIYDKFLDENDLYFSWSNFCTIDECVHNKEFDCKYCSYIGGKK